MRICIREDESRILKSEKSPNEFREASRVNLSVDNIEEVDALIKWLREFKSNFPNYKNDYGHSHFCDFPKNRDFSYDNADIIISKVSPKPLQNKRGRVQSSKNCTKFRVVVIKEGKLFVAVSLEWWITAQGKTIEEARKTVEMLLVQQQWMFKKEKKNVKYGPVLSAPKEYLDVWESGTRVVCSDPAWKPYLGGNKGWPVVDRFIIDLTKTKWKIVPNKAVK